MGRLRDRRANRAADRALVANAAPSSYLVVPAMRPDKSNASMIADDRSVMAVSPKPIAPLAPSFHAKRPETVDPSHACT
jgi:hypothetical protein